MCTRGVLILNGLGNGKQHHIAICNQENLFKKMRENYVMCKMLLLKMNNSKIIMYIKYIVDTYFVYAIVNLTLNIKNVCNKKLK